MSELLPPTQARALQSGLLEYLTTTFALADGDAQTALREFLTDPDSGLFKGPYLRTSLPFRAAPRRSADGLSWTPPGFSPYGHQAAAFARLNSAERRPLPTLVTTGTGSGKTEAFTYPVLDHIVRAKRAGQTGVKALFLYPMNALATDQASRLAKLISATGENPWGTITAAIYTGDQTHERTKVSDQGLITSREVIRSAPPDVLLTNYKMLDQLLLREADQRIWAQSAETLQYLVLDEFHTYDGAQGTDVAMLLHRLGLALKSYWPTRGTVADSHSTDEWSRPLGRITPVGTSATLGGGTDAGLAQMVDFATTIFGEPFDRDCVVTESRRDIAEWTGDATKRVEDRGLRPVIVTTSGAAGIHQLAQAGGLDAQALCHRVLVAMYDAADQENPATFPNPDDHDGLINLAKAHPLVRALISKTAAATHIDRLADDPELFRGESLDPTSHQVRADFLLDLASALGHLRALPDRQAVGTETHLWIRELSRIDRYAGTQVRYRWADDGTPASDMEDPTGAQQEWFPALYCRHCGRSGWGVQLANTGSDLTADDAHIRRNHANHSGRFRALINATREAETIDETATHSNEIDTRLMWFHTQHRHFEVQPPEPDDDDYRAGLILPVLMLTGDDADQRSKNDECPSCGKPDGIRFLGSAIATLLSVTMSNLFGAAGIDPSDKKALVFADSVQDAAHYAGFISARSHSITLRAVLREALDDDEIKTLPELTERVLELTRSDRFRRYRMLPAELADDPEMKPFWASPTWSGIPTAIRTKVRNRLAFDATLEFGLSGGFGRTLERTGSVWATVGTPSSDDLASIARQTLAEIAQDRLDEPLTAIPDDELVGWVRGVLERMRTQGAIGHHWFDSFITNDGNQFFLWGGRPRNVGMPAFPKGRSIPGFPYVGGPSLTGGASGKNMQLDPVVGSRSWYADWTRKVLGVPAALGGVLAKQLLAGLTKAGILDSSITKTGRTVYQIRPDHLLVGAVRAEQLANGAVTLRCDVCRTPYSASPDAVRGLADGPCMAPRCSGRLHRQPGDPNNAYRTLYASSNMRKVISREHTSLLDNSTRADYENTFKNAAADPGAPNVLVATPTLEMGIDIGDLSTVFLAGLPRRVANYVQRVGRAGRLTGNALDMAYVRGRGEFLPRLGEPESLINGEVAPPATYLSAEEILKRQYLACVAGELVRDDVDAHHPRTIAAAMNPDLGYFLDAMIRLGEQPGGIDAFLDTFADLDPSAKSTLQAWATPGETPCSSDLAAMVYSAVGSWRHEQESLVHRKDQILKVLGELEKASNLHGSSSEDRQHFEAAKAELDLVEQQLARATTMDQRTAQGALLHVNKQIAETGTEYWISALERVGIFPNYTLLDDTVTLDIAMNWLNPDTGQYEHEPVSYQRGSANALRDFAPGATFYAHGYGIQVDSVDLGPEAEAVRSWVFCPQCGYGQDLTERGQVPAECPRCGTDGIGEVGNQLDVIEFKKASANVNRESARISDASDERVRAGFTTMLAADIDPDRIDRQWFTEGTQFGAKLVNRLTLRFLNLGKRVEQGSQRMIAGEQHFVPLFQVCHGCGHLNTQTRANSRVEHAPWCPHRDDPAEHNKNVALSRTLVTQGVLLPLPWQLTSGDHFAIPSLETAVLMGLRDEFGGSPDHLGVAVVTDPTTPGEDKLPALLLHDQVPGGTGYLAKLADPHAVWMMLHSAWKRLRDCPCQNEERLACHRCLLPYAAPWQVDRVSRMSAERHLREILTGSASGPEPTAQMTWQITHVATASAHSDESFLEQRFRVEFAKRLDSVATITEKPGATGNILALSAGPQQFVLRPQIATLGSKPDFELTGSGITPVDIFTDGLAFHASPHINRVADDAHKRAVLRLDGKHVLAVTMADCNAEADHLASGQFPAAPSWLDERLTGRLRQQYGFSPAALTALTTGPFGYLSYLISGESAAGLRRFSDAVPGYFMMGVDGSASPEVYLPEDQTLTEAAARFIAGYPIVPAGASRVFWWRHNELGMLVDARKGFPHLNACLILDDRPQAVSSETFADSWREWLQISNALIARSPHLEIEIVSVSLVQQGLTAAAVPEAAHDAVKAVLATPRVDIIAAPGLSAEWQGVVQAIDDHRLATIVRDLADAGMPVPDAGEEIAGIPTDLSWPDAKVVVVAQPEADDQELLEAEGWSLAPADLEQIVAAVKGQ
ncbi:DEAD/DEAH box helicase [Propionimicrobium sp. PCR01-08-3]|uniref:DEAD/DEAH box helicase n=1 Tax=Propionimicrobium sp. PCR01-08-3 TaxID=3052086 RepID=UPI00255C761C|nr:DEAD/DEAH box helicase [Propionimicrobium sp. PCR01-08-3]WIY83987.1 DEAD/DEAH box helicase [Propionimicrobium sp. PCR01-08-3]